ncbi:MAG: c-type cytochrome [Acidimicrobiia bacterium]|nr:c-type cytochrome [Acidimicrobiia bacterium]
MGLNSVIITLVGLGAVAWFAFLANTRSRSRTRDQVPANLSTGATDDELETRRLDRTLAAAVISSAFMAVALPIYYLGEADRQEGFVEEFAHTDVEHGLEIWEEFGCAGCHGPEGVGGSAAFLEARSRVNITAWEAPSVNDVLYRYEPDEVRFWLVYGRPNSPMPPWGLEGGGPLNSQQIDDLIAYLASIQIPQDDALVQIEPKVEAALARLDASADAVATQEASQLALIDAIEAAETLAPLAASIAEEASGILEGAGDGLDTDGDGVADRAERQLSDLSAQATDAGVLEAAISLDPVNAETTLGTSDAKAAETIVSELEAQASSLAVTVDTQDVLLEQASFGLAFIEEAAAERRWTVDFQAVADATFAGNVDEAQRAVGLFNAYCARCHTAGYSAGPTFQQEQASGAIGPSLRDGRAGTQFLTEMDLVDFLIKGSENGIGYGVNGVGSGRMPGWGAVLSAEDLDLIAKYLRGPTLDGVEFVEEAPGA